MQIWHHNIRHTYIIAIKDVTILEKIREKEELPMGILDITVLAEVSQASTPIDLDAKSKWAINNADLDIAQKLGQIDIKKY